MKIGYYQFRPLFGRVEKNLAKVLSALEECDADLIVLPELAFTGYYFRDRNELAQLAENPKTSKTVDALIAICKRKQFHIVTGFAEKYEDKIFNSALLIGPSGIEHTYRKLHLFNEEKNTFDVGDIPLCVQDINGVKIGIMVCFDWAFPEVTRSLVLQGAQIICHPSNLVLTFCQQTMLTRCLENRVFAITTNRFGSDVRPQGKLTFTGRSQIVMPGGVLAHRARSQQAELFIMEIDPEQADDKSITPLNDLLSDRRPDCYDVLLK